MSERASGSGRLSGRGVGSSFVSLLEKLHGQDLYSLRLAPRRFLKERDLPRAGGRAVRYRRDARMCTIEQREEGAHEATQNGKRKGEEERREHCALTYLSQRTHPLARPPLSPRRVAAFPNRRPHFYRRILRPASLLCPAVSLFVRTGSLGATAT